MKPRRANYGPQSRTHDQKRLAALMLVTQHRTPETLTPADVARGSGLGEAECAALLAQAALRRSL